MNPHKTPIVDASVAAAVHRAVLPGGDAGDDSAAAQNARSVLDWRRRNPRLPQGRLEHPSTAARWHQVSAEELERERGPDQAESLTQEEILGMTPDRGLGVRYYGRRRR